MSVADLQELEEIKGLVNRGQQLGVLTFAEIVSPRDSVLWDS